MIFKRPDSPCRVSITEALGRRQPMVRGMNPFVLQRIMEVVGPDNERCKIAISGEREGIGYYEVTVGGRTVRFDLDGEPQ